MLHLPASTSIGFCYTPRKHGGLGLLRLKNTIMLAQLKGGIKMSQSYDKVTKLALERTNLMKFYKDTANSYNLSWPPNIKEIETEKIKQKKLDQKDWHDKHLQGQGVQYFANDTIGNSWLRDPTLLRGSRFIDAIRLRTNTVGTKVVLSQIKPSADIMCRRCHLKSETLGHILGQCIETKPKRIKRHNDICELLVKQLSKTGIVYSEAKIQGNGELKKPDIIYKNDNKLAIIDVTVRYEDRRSLHDAMEEKIKKYKNIAEQLKIQMGCETTEVIPIVIGSRGAIPKETKDRILQLGFRKPEILTASLIALRSSIEQVNAFIDYD
ncbi:Retrovirus-related Pol polyprotein from type-1 retrotransposable element R2 (Fragment) [Anthophora retusa]